LVGDKQWPSLKLQHFSLRGFETLGNLGGPSFASGLRMTINLADYEHITSAVIASAIEVHKTTGAGMLERAYMPCLEFELRQRGLRFKVQHPIKFLYKGVSLDMACRPDLIVDDAVVVELKSVAAILPIHEAQLLTYMRLANCPVGLIINFNVPRLVDGVRRKVNPRATIASTDKSRATPGT
jgi:GxxExxY protein